MPPRMRVETTGSGSSVARADTGSKADMPSSAEGPRVPRPSVAVAQPPAPSPKPHVDAPKPSMSAPQPSESPAAAPAPKVTKVKASVAVSSGPESAPASSTGSVAAGLGGTASTQSSRPKIGVQGESSGYDFANEFAQDDQGAYSSSSIADQEPPTAPKKPMFRPSVKGFNNWVHTTFPGHEHAFIGGLVALLLAILVLVVGPVYVILLSLSALAGVAVGQYFDGDPKIIRMITGLFNSDREQ